MLRVWNLSLVDRDVLPHDPRHVPHPVGRHRLGARVHAVRRSVRGCSRSSASSPRPASGSSRGAATCSARPGASTRAVSRESAFLANNLLFAALAFVVLLGTVFPLRRRGAAGLAALGRGAVLRPHDHADRPRAAVPDGGGAGAAVAGDERRSGAPPPARARRGSAGSRCSSRWCSAPAAARRCSPTGSARSRPPASCASSCSVCAVDAGRSASRVAASRSGARPRSQPAALRRPRRPLRRRAHRGRARGVVGVRDEPRGAARARASRRRSSRLHAHVPRASHTARSARRRPSRPTCGSSAATATSACTRPRSRRIPNSTEGIGTPSVHTGVLDDVYLTLVSSPNERRAITLGVRGNPMIVWLWIGGGVMALGTILALAPRLRDRTSAGPEPTATRARRAAREPPTSRAARRGAGVKHPARWIALAVARRRRRVRGRARAQRRATTRSRREAEPPRSGKAAPAFDLADPRRAGRVTAVDLAGQGGHRELLEHVVHPVPARSSRRSRSSTPRTRTTPTSRWSASCATRRRRRGDPALRRTRGHGVDHRARSRTTRPRSTSRRAVSPRRSRSRPTASIVGVAVRAGDACASLETMLAARAGRT